MTKDQGPNSLNRLMVVINMNSLRSKITRREACLWTKGPSRLSKDHRPKNRPNTWRKEEPKEIKAFVKVEDVCIVKNTMDVAQNNKLEFQELLEHHPF
jgi:hypothetical protein